MENSIKSKEINPQISIIVPVKKISKWIGLIRKNLLICSLNNLSVEFIFVCTKCSDDDSILDLLDLFPLVRGSTVNAQIVSTIEPGIYAAMNRGIFQAKGTYLLFLGADDELLEQFPYTVQRINSAINSPCIFAEAKLNCQNQQLSYKYSAGRSGQIHWLLGMPRIHQAIFYNLEYIIKNNITYSTKLKICSDYILTSEILSDYGGEITSFNECIVSYNVTGYSSTFDSSALYIEHILGFYHSLKLRRYLPLIVLTRIVLTLFKAMRRHAKQNFNGN